MQGNPMKVSKAGFFVMAACAIAQADITGTVIDEAGAPIHNAVVTTRSLPSLLSNARTLTDEKGVFVIDEASLGIKKSVQFKKDIISFNGKKNVSIEILDLKGKVVKSKSLDSNTGTYPIRNATKLTKGLSKGMYVIAVNIDGKRTPISKIRTTSNETEFLKKEAEQSLVIRKAGFLPDMDFIVFSDYFYPQVEYLHQLLVQKRFQARSLRQ